ncbi:hypothetical protein GKZ68_09635 [Hymenobacter sp. BRD128]|uniref:AbiJ-NTD4 domain-containing protein n=1 Tax=Hymenobacter sp. BRD128 TaxID=2675878 RepID=UPI0015673BA0|nr:hypothetical protein [Hymenobacter sp. BRD128]QKG56862.1 hypothetical protein GKZ68_09635 [Hymenobacter sp. BRD128]
MSFSKRMGIVSSVKMMQLEAIDAELRNGLWNGLKIFLLDYLDKNNRYSQQTSFDVLCQLLWLHFYKLPIDTIPSNTYRAEEVIREKYFKSKWFEVYDLLEFIINLNQEVIRFNAEEFKAFCNFTLESENSGYRFVDNRIAPITNTTETSEIEEAINSVGNFTALKGANTHLRAALDMLSDKKNPDYRNSIKESISAVESVTKRISDNKNDTLGGALDKIKGKLKIHPSLERGFKQIYGYTSDADGIRHAIIEDANCDFEDAKLMLVSCSAFINYLISRANKIGVDFN